MGNAWLSAPASLDIEVTSGCWPGSEEREESETEGGMLLKTPLSGRRYEQS